MFSRRPGGFLQGVVTPTHANDDIEAGGVLTLMMGFRWHAIQLRHENAWVHFVGEGRAVA